MVGRAGRARYGRQVAEAEMSRGKPRLFSASATRRLLATRTTRPMNRGWRINPGLHENSPVARFRLPGAIRCRSSGAVVLTPPVPPNLRTPRRFHLLVATKFTDEPFVFYQAFPPPPRPRSRAPEVEKEDEDDSFWLQPKIAPSQHE